MLFSNMVLGTHSTGARSRSSPAGGRPPIYAPDMMLSTHSTNASQIVVGSLKPSKVMAVQAAAAAVFPVSDVSVLGKRLQVFHP